MTANEWHEETGVRFGSDSKFVRVMARCVVLATLTLIPLAGSAGAAEAEFPYGQELLLDAPAMKGGKRVPSFEVDSNGRGSVDLWCNSVTAQFVVAGDTVTILTGAKTDRRCDPERMRADEDMLAALLQVTNWRRHDDVLILQGGRSLRFRPATN
jgi:heat shock protein HslJ